MSEGQPWIDRVMVPIANKVSTTTYNRIYEAVSRGTEGQGKALVEAILSELKPNQPERPFLLSPSKKRP